MKIKIYWLIFISLLFILVSNIYSQELSADEKQTLINNLANIDSIGENSSWTAIVKITDFNVSEALSEIERNIWIQKPSTQQLFIEAMAKFNSPSLDAVANAYLDSLDADNNADYSLRFFVIELLFRIGDYSRYGYALEEVEKENPDVTGQLITILSEIIKHVPNENERAKEGLIKIAAEAEHSIYRYYAIVDLEEIYNEELMPYFIERFSVDDKKMRNRIISFIFKKYKDERIRNVYKEKFYDETGAGIRYDMAEELLYKYGNPSDYNFIKDYLASGVETDTFNLYSMPSWIESYKAPQPDSITPTSTMLDTLTSYTNQCFGYEWLKDEAYKNELLNKITDAKSKLNSGDSLGCRTEVASFQNSVNQVYQDSAGSYPKYISEDGYKFLFYYAQYILDRLPEHAKIHSPNTTNEHYHTN